jgi:hypothetical protein
MRDLFWRLAGAVVLLGLGAGAQAATSAPAAAACDRRCLLEQLTTYTEALTDNEPGHVPVAPGVRITANGAVQQAVGKSEVWGAIRRIPYRHALVDPETGTAIFLGVLTNTPTRNAERWWFYALRLKVQGRQVTEIEEISFDGTLGGTPASTLRLPERVFDAVLPPAERSSREQLFAIANSYFDAVSQEKPYAQVPWHPECQRIELGVFTVNSGLQGGSCGGEFKNPATKWNVRNRRFYIADVERGVVVAIGNFTTPPEYPNNNGSVVFEVFKVQDGLIRHIEAFFRGNGQLHSGWGEGPGS